MAKASTRPQLLSRWLFRDLIATCFASFSRMTPLVGLAPDGFLTMMVRPEDLDEYHPLR